jgi:glutamate 5-kinase
MATLTPQLAQFSRIVIKIGSSLLIDHARGELRSEWLKSLCDDVFALKYRGAEVIIVSSGAIALGRTRLKLKKGALKLEESQAAASIGQIELARVWQETLGSYGIIASQILVTLSDTEERQRYLNARSTIETLLKWGVIPVVNENDTVATSEIRFGDNDRLAARVAGMVSADCLILFSDIDGLYTAPPHLDPQAKLIPVIPKITAEIENMAGAAASELSRGGMFTKIEAAKIATAAGCTMVIASGKAMNPISTMGLCSWFLAPATPVTARKKWIAGQLEPKGVITVDKGAENALSKGNSLLPAGVIKVEGAFERGDAVIIKSETGDEIGRGLIAYDAIDADKIKGLKSKLIEEKLGQDMPAELIHRDDIAFIS